MLQRGKGERTGKNEHTLRLLSFAELAPVARTKLPYGDVAKKFDDDAKRMLTKTTIAAGEAEKESPLTCESHPLLPSSFGCLAAGEPKLAPGPSPRILIQKLRRSSCRRRT